MVEPKVLLVSISIPARVDKVPEVGSVRVVVPPVVRVKLSVPKLMVLPFAICKIPEVEALPEVS